jgi:AraC-like DNA-binding protein
MQKGGYFRDPDLTLAKLAVALGASQARITRAVNDGLGQNFSEAVNHLRVRDVVRRLEDPLEQRDLLELALASGFSSKQTFNRCFRRIVGTTPSAYRRSVRRDTTSQVALDA